MFLVHSHATHDLPTTHPVSTIPWIALHTFVVSHTARPLLISSCFTFCLWLGPSAFHPLIALDVIVVIRIIPSAFLERSGLWLLLLILGRWRR